MIFVGEVVEIAPTEAAEYVLVRICSKTARISLHMPIEDAAGIAFLEKCTITIDWLPNNNPDPHTQATVKRKTDVT